MKPIFHPRLVNDVYSDPGLFIEFLFDKRALLFDLGDISRLSNSALLKISHVFVSHTHIDHFYGFDRLLRVLFGRAKTLRLYGPMNFIDNVEGKLAGFTWNLVERYNESLTIEVAEVRGGHIRKARFRAIEKFKRSEETETPWTSDVLVEEPSFSVRAAILEHRVPCLGFALKEKFHVNVKKDRLEALQLLPGPWLNDMKNLIFEGKPDATPVRIAYRENGAKKVRVTPLGDLKNDLVMISPGQKIGYIVDTVFNDTNKKRIVDLIRGADLFFCESPFLSEEEERGRDRCHLTARQAGLLAREAGVKRLQTFHFSPKHLSRKDQLIREAQDAFLGVDAETAGSAPV